MSILPKATPAPKPKTKATFQISVLFAVLLVIMAVAQLFTFEDFVPLTLTYNLPWLSPYLVAPLIVTAEVFAIPFLLRMSLSPAFRILSMFLGWLTAGLWFYISFWVVSTAQAVDTIGFLGTVGTFTPGWWAVCFSFALGILAAWASWGMWPSFKFPKTKK